MLRIYIIGVAILLIAIIANIIVGKLDISTWYDFGPTLSSKGFLAIKEAGLLSVLWLFIIYPIILACGYLIGDKLYKMIFL